MLIFSHYVSYYQLTQFAGDDVNLILKLSPSKLVIDVKTLT